MMLLPMVVAVVVMVTIFASCIQRSLCHDGGQAQESQNSCHDTGRTTVEDYAATPIIEVTICSIEQNSIAAPCSNRPQTALSLCEPLLKKP